MSKLKRQSTLQSISSYRKWLENQVKAFKNQVNSRKTLRCLNLLQIMKDLNYELVPLHKRPDLLQQCCQLLNSEWKRSDTARLKSLSVSCDKYPTCLLLVSDNKVYGHCKVSLLDNAATNENSAIIESFIIDQKRRSQGLGSMLLHAIECYMYQSGIRSVYLLTKGQEGFYSKNGYIPCKAIPNVYGFSEADTDSDSINENETKLERKESISAGPPPPPMPTDMRRPSTQICLITYSRTFMKKSLDSSYAKQTL